MRRSLALALVSVILAGCAAPAASTEQPSADASAAAPTTFPSEGPPASPTASATPVPPTPQSSGPLTIESSCTDLYDFEVPRVEVNPEIGRFYAEFAPHRLVPREHPEVTFEVESAPEINAGVLVGGHDLRMKVWVWYSYDVHGEIGPLEVRGSGATLRADGHDPIDLDVDIAARDVDAALWDVVVHDVPDWDARASLELSFRWRDRCFTYAARTPIDGIKLVGTATTAGCGMTERRYEDDFSAALKAPLQVGSGTARIVSPWSKARYLPIDYPGIDVHPAFGWDRDAAPIVAAPDEILIVRREAPGFELLDMGAVGWTRKNFVDQSDVWPPKLEAVFHRSPERQPDGSFRLRVPSEPGRYVVTLSFPFDWTCGTGDVWSVFSLDVVTADSGAL